MAASILQQLLALYFAIIYNWQLSSSEKSLVEKKNSSMYLKDFAGLDFFIYFFIYLFICFFIFFYKCLFTLSVMQSVCYTISSQPFFGWETPKHNSFDQFWKFNFYFEHFPRNTRFLSFGGPSNYLYLFKNYRQTFHDQGNVDHPTSKLLKCDLVQALHTFQNPSFGFFAAGKASLVVN